MKNFDFQPSQWQQQFISEFVATDRQRNTLVAAYGTGKTLAAIHAAQKRLEQGKSKKLVVLSDMRVRLEMWAETAMNNQIDLRLADSTSVKDGIALSYRDLPNNDNLDRLMELASTGGLLIIVDDLHRSQTAAINFVDQLLDENDTNQCLFISSTPLIGSTIDWTFRIEREFYLTSGELILPDTKLHIAKLSPSLNLLPALHAKTKSLDDLNWRQFEIIIYELLQSDGFEVELMRGSKDNGVDIVAVKDLGEHGLFKALWQAKKYKSGRKIGIETIRELADVRNEHKASKGIIVTSSFLTSGALQRVQRDQYMLGKVDRNDLDAWIERKLFGHNN